MGMQFFLQMFNNTVAEDGACSKMCSSAGERRTQVRGNLVETQPHTLIPGSRLTRFVGEAAPREQGIRRPPLISRGRDHLLGVL